MMRSGVFLILFLIINCTAYGQLRSFQNLVFEGAGIRGLAYAGAIAALESRHQLDSVKRVGGTSAGAIVALLLSIGYRADEIAGIISSTNFRKFNDGNWLLAGGIYRLSNYFGWYRGKRFGQWLAQLIRAKTGNADITFKELKEAGFKDLYVTGTSLNQQQAVVFSYEQFPNMKIKDAVRISMAIPLYFEPVFIDANGHIVAHPRKKEGLQVMVDGGLVANFPIRLFDSTRYIMPEGANQFFRNSNTLGFRIDNAQQITYDSLAKGLAPLPVTNLKQYFIAFYNIVIENLNRQQLTNDDWQRTVSISDGGIGPRIRKMSVNEVETLITNGREAAQLYLQHH